MVQHQVDAVQGQCIRGRRPGTGRGRGRRRSRGDRSAGTRVTGRWCPTMAARHSTLSARRSSVPTGHSNLRVINTEAPDWDVRLAELPGHYSVVGGPLRVQAFKQLAEAAEPGQDEGTVAVIDARPDKGDRHEGGQVAEQQDMYRREEMLASMARRCKVDPLLVLCEDDPAFSHSPIRISDLMTV